MTANPQENLPSSAPAGPEMPETRRSDAPSPMLVIISGPSGVGKDTIIEALQRRGHLPAYHYVVTCTTRAPRGNEIDGVSYNFVTVPEFLALRDAGELLEANEVHGNWYGTPRRQVADALAAGRHAILKIDVQGADVVRARVPDALLIFIAPPSVDALLERLTSRATETADELALRQRNAAAEMARQKDYDYVVVNETGELTRTAERIGEIIALEGARHAERRVRI